MKGSRRHGEFYGIPFDFRRPTLARIKARMWNPQAGMLTPHIFGAGWTLNLAHRGSQLLLGGITLALAFSILAG